MADTTKFYYDFHFPMPIVELILTLLGKKQAAPATAAAPATREWFSQTRTSLNTTTEVITTTFRLPLSVSEISTEVLRMPCVLEVWYQDRSNAWKPVLDAQRNPLKVMVAKSDTKSWYKHKTRCYPIVAKQLQFRLTRTPDPDLADIPYPVGLRNTLIRRNVYDRAQGGSFEDYVDIMGNVVSRYIKDWDASRAVDDNYATFWKSAPLPDPAAVANLYLDVRSSTGAPQVVDKIYLDPVYTGQHLNLYYTSDDTVGPRTLSPIALPASNIANMEWRPSTGLYDLISGEGQSSYQFLMNIGPLTAQAAWIGVEWQPAFGSANANLATNPLLWAVNAPADGMFRPTLYYDPGTRKFALQFFDGSDARVYQTAALSGPWSVSEPVRVIAGWSYNPNRVWIKAVTQAGVVLTELDAAPTTLPTGVSLDGVVEFANVRGALKNVVVKLDDPARGATSFLADPALYTDPDPVVRDENGRMPSTSLDNAVYAAPFGSREHGCGGSDESHFDAKEWTPVWRDYVAVKGFLHLPAPVAAKFLKLEFTNLTEEPYPIYESGVETRYKVFPVSVTQQSSVGPKLYTGTGGFLGLGTFISKNGVRSVNWLNPTSVLQAIGAVIGTQIPPVVINTGIPYVTTTLPNRGSELVEQSRQIEVASSYVYARDDLQPYVLAQNQFHTVIKAEGLQAIQPYVDVPWKEIEAANPGAVTKVKSTGTVPVRGTDWWIYPGQQLRVPASVMTKLTATQTVIERKQTLENRVRFNTVSVHRYDYRTVKRDAAIAYFAGVREVQPYTSTYIPGEDRPVYDFPIYDPAQWTFDPHVVRATRINDRGQEEYLGPIGITLPGPGTAFKTLTTQSDFARLRLDYRDTGVLHSNTMWASTVDDNNEQLSPYITILPSTIPTGTWADVTKRWADTEAQWGSPFGIIAANLSDERRYQGTRVLAFNRDADVSSAIGAESGVEAGINLSQQVNFVPKALMRFGVVFLKPYANSNVLRLRMARASDNTMIYTQTFTPQVGRWVEHTTEFVEIPETLTNGGFSVGSLSTWTPGGAASWTQDNTVGRTGVGSAKVVKSASAGVQTLQTEKMLFYANETISCAAWVKWSGMTGTGETIKVQAVYYSGETVVSTVDLDGVTVTDPAAAGGWTPIGGSTVAPASGADRVALQVVVTAGHTGTVWVDDVTASVPGAARQTYNLTLTVVGDNKDSLYVADLYTQIAPIRYFVQLGGPGSYLHEVTDLRYTKAETVLTAPSPVHQFSLRTVVCHPKAWAFGCQATPLYLK